MTLFALFQDLHSSEKRASSQNSLKSVLEMIHINAFNTLPVFAFTTIAFGELLPVVESKALRGKLHQLHTLKAIRSFKL